MKIAVSASNPDLTSPVDPRFGRCSYFIFIDPETMGFEAVKNPNVSSSSGAGIQAAQLVSEKGAQVVLTGHCGPNAFQTLQAAGIELFVGVRGSVQEAVEQYRSGKLQLAGQPNAPPHAGMGGAAYQDVGSGRSGGMGRRRGVSRRRGMRYSPFPPAAETINITPPKPQLSPEEEIQQLKHQANYLRKQIENISRRIEELEKRK